MNINKFVELIKNRLHIYSAKTYKDGSTVFCDYIKKEYGELLANNPVKMVEISVKGMLPKNTLGHQEFMKMHVYAGEEHKH